MDDLDSRCPAANADFPEEELLLLNENGRYNQPVDDSSNGVTDEDSCSSFKTKSDQEMIDKIFDKCDASHLGEVKASILLNFMRHNADANMFPEPFSKALFETLQQMLDPDSTDRLVQRQAFYIVMNNWLKKLKILQNDLQLDLDPPYCSTPLLPKTMNPEDFPALTEESYSIVNKDGSKATIHTCDCLEENHELNHKLKQQESLIEDLNSQIVATQDGLSIQIERNKRLEEELSKIKLVCQHIHQLEKERDQLKELLSTAEEKVRKLEKQHQQFRRERRELQEQLQTLEDVKLDISIDLEKSRKLNCALQNDNISLKDELQKSEVVASQYLNKIKLQTNTIRDLSTKMTDLNDTLQMLKDERDVSISRRISLTAEQDPYGSPLRYPPSPVKFSPLYKCGSTVKKNLFYVDCVMNNNLATMTSTPRKTARLSLFEEMEALGEPEDKSFIQNNLGGGDCYSIDSEKQELMKVIEELNCQVERMKQCNAASATQLENQEVKLLLKHTDASLATATSAPCQTDHSSEVDSTTQHSQTNSMIKTSLFSQHTQTDNTLRNEFTSQHSQTEVLMSVESSQTESATTSQLSQTEAAATCETCRTEVTVISQSSQTETAVKSKSNQTCFVVTCKSSQTDETKVTVESQHCQTELKIPQEFESVHSQTDTEGLEEFVSSQKRKVTYIDTSTLTDIKTAFEATTQTPNDSTITSGIPRKRNRVEEYFPTEVNTSSEIQWDAAEVGLHLVQTLLLCNKSTASQTEVAVLNAAETQTEIAIPERFHKASIGHSLEDETASRYNEVFGSPKSPHISEFSVVPHFTYMSELELWVQDQANLCERRLQREKCRLLAVVRRSNSGRHMELCAAAGTAADELPLKSEPTCPGQNDAPSEEGVVTSEEDASASTAAETAPEDSDAGGGVFPSISDRLLRELGVDAPNELLTEQDIENRFTSLLLAFQADKLTLGRRYDWQHRQREQAGHNMVAELSRLRNALHNLNYLCVDSESIEILQQIRSQVDLLQQSADRVFCAAEMFGAVQQENRVSNAIDVMLAHVNNLKKMYEKDHSELEETRRLLQENNIVAEDGHDPAEDTPRSGRYRSLQSLIGSGKVGSKRRASIATIPRPSSSGDGSKINSFTPHFVDSKSRSVSTLRCRRPSLATIASSGDALTSASESSDRGVDRTEGFGGMDEITELVEGRRESAASDSQESSGVAPEENNNCKTGPAAPLPNPLIRRESVIKSIGADGDLTDDDAFLSVVGEPMLQLDDTVIHHERTMWTDVMNAVHSVCLEVRLFAQQSLQRASDMGLNVFQVLRFSLTAILLLAAVWSLASSFLYADALPCQRVPLRWLTLSELMEFFITFQRCGPPPT